MKNINNKLSRHLTVEEYEAIIECGKIMENKLGVKLHTVEIRPDMKQADVLFCINFMCDTHYERGLK